MGKEARRKVLANLRIVNNCVVGLLDCAQKPAPSGWIDTLNTVAAGLEYQLKVIRAMIADATGSKTDGERFASKAKRLLSESRETLTQWKIRQPKPHYDKAAIHERIWQLRQEGLGPVEIAGQLTREGWTTCRGGEWSWQGVAYVARRQGVTA